MIFSINPEPSKNEFDKLLNSTITELNTHAKKSTQRVSTLIGRNLEPYVKDVMSNLAIGTPFENSIELIGGQKFPDIVSRIPNLIEKKYYGIEVKTTTQNHWKTTGNSVLEATRVENVERIFMLFAKLASPIEFRCRPYEEVLSEVVVTHSPRYLIDMNLEKGKTIFDKIQLSYDDLRLKENPIKPIVDYYKSKLKPGEELWWMDSQTEVGGLKLRFWNNISKQEKENLTIHGMTLFPEIFGKSQDKFNRFAFWLVSKHNIVCPNTRDLFTAGGRDKFDIKGDTFENVPRIILNLFENIEEVIEIISTTPADELSDYWKIEVTERNKIQIWIQLVSGYTGRMRDINHINVEIIIKNLLNF